MDYSVIARRLIKDLKLIVGYPDEVILAQRLLATVMYGELPWYKAKTVVMIDPRRRRHVPGDRKSDRSGTVLR